MSANDIPVAVVMGVVEELKTTLVRLDEKLDAKLGDHATRIVRTEVQQENLQREINALQAGLREATNGRRWAITTLIAVVAALVAIGSLVVVIQGG